MMRGGGQRLMTEYDDDPPTMSLLSEYVELHSRGKYFPGTSVCKHTIMIEHLMYKYHAKTVLDYGSGRGMQYIASRIHERWGLKTLPRCYDPAVKGIDVLPAVNEKFDAVICADVMEHVPECEVPETLLRIINYAVSFVFFSISLTPAGKTLPNGMNAHVTLKDELWWRDMIMFANPDSKPVYVTFVGKNREKTYLELLP